MSAIKRELIKDPDTGELVLRKTFTFDFTGKTPFNDTDLAELSRWEEAASTPGRLRSARAELPELSGLPEHDQALEAIVQGEYYTARSEWQPAELALMRFYALQAHGKRRLAARQVGQARAARSKGGKSAADAKHALASKRNAKLLAHRERLLRAGHEPREIAAILAPKFDLTPKQVRTIVKKGGS